ncbi:cytochrome b [Variovorax sp. ZS18.2.2]|uniref:cytochrome b n=1 Tax=Variovorax sp. ZS18.2.2 TaxID=2971255 RepID=UPI002151DB93|nr:cytochrome b [Variovorax sp. ZS18.2.2]MCR6475526.1 cytochrome b [Variovorax sp. ZS18.2.2]
MLFHWLIAAAVFAAIGMGLYMTSPPITPLRFRVYNWHKWLGVCLLLATVLRVAWRIRHAPPPPLDGVMKSLEVLAARAVHFLLYALCFLVPLSGWAYTTAEGRPVVLFGRFPLPDFVPVNPALADVLKITHHWLAWTLSALILLHIAAALKHRFVDRDGVLARMLPSSPFRRSA